MCLQIILTIIGSTVAVMTLLLGVQFLVLRLMIKNVILRLETKIETKFDECREQLKIEIKSEVIDAFTKALEQNGITKKN